MHEQHREGSDDFIGLNIWWNLNGLRGLFLTAGKRIMLLALTANAEKINPMSQNHKTDFFSNLFCEVFRATPES